MNDGSSLTTIGELSAAEDLMVMGRHEGKINLPGHGLTIGATASVRGEVLAKSVIVLGSLVGQVTAVERFDLRAGGTLDGTVTTKRLAMEIGATLQGKVSMESQEDRS